MTDGIIQNVLQELQYFYDIHTEIKASHGLSHALAVYRHAQKATACHHPKLSDEECMEIHVASLLHDVDDVKYFPKPHPPQQQQHHHNHDNHDNGDEENDDTFQNAKEIMQSAKVPFQSQERILFMIRNVSCSSNGNDIPELVKKHNHYHLLIPRWSDRLEAVGPTGVVRCYLYNQEKHLPLSSSESPRATTYDQVWEYATPERFVQYQRRGGSSVDMISHYYDKLLHIARPPANGVRNAYLEEMQQECSKEMLEVCIRFGKYGFVDEDYILDIGKRLSMER